MSPTTHVELLYPVGGGVVSDARERAAVALGRRSIVDAFLATDAGRLASRLARIIYDLTSVHGGDGGLTVTPPKTHKCGTMCYLASRLPSGDAPGAEKTLREIHELLEQLAFAEIERGPS